MKRFLCRFYPMVLLLISTAAIATAQPKEHHLANVRQLTFGGDNAEAYFSPDGTKLSFQSNNK